MGYLSQPDLSDKAENLSHELFDFRVEQPNSFTTIILMKYLPEWNGDEYDDVYDVKYVYEIRFNHATHEFMMMLPNEVEPRKPTPESEYDFERHGAIVHDEFRDVVLELNSGIEHESGVYEWLPDFIERCRLERISDVAPGVGAVSVNRLYEEFGSLREINDTPDDALSDELYNDDAIDVLKAR